jgi:hypothetical protein
MNEHESTEFERQSQAVLDESVARLDGRTRSRLNQARQQALAEAESLATSPWKKWFSVGTLMPAGAVAAAAIVALTLWSGPRPVDGTDLMARSDATTTFEDLDLLADTDAVDGEGSVVDYEFYEWAAAEAEAVGT